MRGGQRALALLARGEAQRFDGLDAERLDDRPPGHTANLRRVRSRCAGRAADPRPDPGFGPITFPGFKFSFTARSPSGYRT